MSYGLLCIHSHCSDSDSSRRDEMISRPHDPCQDLWCPTTLVESLSGTIATEAPEEPTRPFREGLPSTYRMRHDRHYVEELSSRSLSGLTDPDPRSVPSAAMAPALAELAGSLKAAASSLALSTEGPVRSYSRMVSEIPGVEIQRAIWLVEGLQVLTERPVVTRTRLSPGAVVDRVLVATRVERRLADVKLSVSRGDGGMTIRGSEPLLVMALGGMLQAMVAARQRGCPGRATTQRGRAGVDCHPRAFSADRGRSRSVARAVFRRPVSRQTWRLRLGGRAGRNEAGHRASQWSSDRRAG